VRLEYFTVGWKVVEAAVGLAAGAASYSIALVGFGLASIIETSPGVALLWRFKQVTLTEHRAESRALSIVRMFLAPPRMSASRRDATCSFVASRTSVCPD
jgi:hypothetical protein